MTITDYIHAFLEQTTTSLPQTSLEVRPDNADEQINQGISYGRLRRP